VGLGTVDSGYRGDVRVFVRTIGSQSYFVWPRERLAQVVFAPVGRAAFPVVEELGESERGDKGFGSTS